MSKNKRKYLLILGLVLLLIPAYFLFASANPKTAERFPFLVFLLAVDFYFWYSIKDQFKKLNKVLKTILSVIYWLPLGAFVVLLALTSVHKYNLTHPALVSYIFGFVMVIYLAKLITVIFFLFADIFRISLFTVRHARAKKTGRPIDHGTHMSRGKFIRTMGLATGGLFFSGMLIGMVRWAHDFRVRRENLFLPNLPESFNGLRIVQISDLHLGSWASADPIAEAASIINDLDPDVVLFTGDLVNYSTNEAYRFRNELGRIRARHGVFAILGNHDYGDYVTWPDETAKVKNLEELYRFFGEMGWQLLRNENQVLERNGDKIAIIGVENWSASKRFPKLGNMTKAISGTENIPVKILMSHDPTHWEKEISHKFNDIDLTLSGHTHGFQFGVELKNFRWSFAQYVYKYWAGLYESTHKGKKQYLYVNRGLGMIGYPGRVGILPEITLITLNS
ncbi:MAG TPA: metallophosphoesterase [Bacteroidales bacterium]|nr:metallophosphoesterase [Bacteroidales bacterium]HOX76798.1 metallophosphoesterase [Bacteroidales bacterium]HPI86443.1 metallophosphoesterase [Bacteroidales bacterium]